MNDDLEMELRSHIREQDRELFILRMKIDCIKELTEIKDDEDRYISDVAYREGWDDAMIQISGFTNKEITPLGKLPPDRASISVSATIESSDKIEPLPFPEYD